MSAYRRETESGELRWHYRKRVQLPDGSRCRVAGKPSLNTKAAAIAAERAHVERVLNPPPPPRPLLPTFAEWFTGRFWEEWVIGSKNKPSERAAKRSIYQHHLGPFFGAMRLDAIDTGVVARFRAGLIQRPEGTRPLSEKRINNILAVLSKALHYAARVRLIGHVPEIGVLRVERPEIVAWEIEEYARILVAAKREGIEWYVASCLAGEAGLRIGEVRGLRWAEDVDLVAGTITVSQQEHKGEVGTPKGRTRRTIPMTERLLDALRSLPVVRTGRVVLPDGEALTDGRTTHAIYRICRRAGLPERAWHTLRHAFGTHAAMFGVNPWRLQTWMGHKRIDETMRYVHVAEAHHRPLPDVVLAAGDAQRDPDRRVLAMLGARGQLATGAPALAAVR
jgi:integrase